VFGNEHRGVSEEAMKHADGNFLIPQFGMLQSLNVSVACAVSLYEVCRQRLAAGQYSVPKYSTEELKLRLEQWGKK
jgi:tRNA (guanosine-2'-O-)-methyltransferase